MTTNAQIAANRRNGAKSTGPRSEAGKTRSSQNALKHGLTAKQVVMFDEDPAKFEALQASLSTHYEPEGPVAEYLVEHLAACIWRLRRVPAIEAGIYSCFRLWIEGEEVRERRNHKEDDIPYGQEDAYRTANKEKERIDEQLHEYQPAIGRAFLRAQCSIESLIRIASAIEGSMYRASRELERMKAGRHDAVNEDFVIDAEVDEEDWPE